MPKVPSSQTIWRLYLWMLTISAGILFVVSACAPVSKPGETPYKLPTLATPVPSKPEIFDDTARGVVCYAWGSNLSCVKYGSN